MPLPSEPRSTNREPARVRALLELTAALVVFEVDVWTLRATEWHVPAMEWRLDLRAPEMIT